MTWFNHLQEDIRSDAAANVILRHAVIDVRPVGVVDDLAGCGVLNVVGNVIVHHNNDVVIRHTVGMNNLDTR